MSKVADRLGLSYHTVRELNKVIDKLPGCPPFQRKVFSIGHEELEFHFRDALECIRSLFGDLQFAQDLIFAPERHYADCDCTHRLYNELYTSDWWWLIQVRSLCSDECHY